MTIERDKKLHLLVGTAIAIVVAMACMWSPLNLNVVPATVIGALVAALAGYLKEKVYDAKRPDRHTVDKKDFYFTAAGGVLGAVLVFAAVSAGVLPLKLALGV